MLSHVVAIGDVVTKGDSPVQGDAPRIEESPVRCLDQSASALMVDAIDRAKDARDTLGGVFEVLAHGVPAGIGSHVHYDRRLDAILAGGLMSVQGIKGVEIGDGFASAAMPGSSSHDEIVRVGTGDIGRESNRAGGIEGGISNGEPIRLRAAMKPLPTLMSPLRTVDMTTGEDSVAVRERSDVCAVPAAAVVGEQMVAIGLAQEFQRKFGGDTVEEFTSAIDRYIDDVKKRSRS